MGPLPAVASRGEGEWHFKSKWVLPLQPKNAADLLTFGSRGRPCELRAFLGAKETWSMAITHYCTILGSNLSNAHVADATHRSVQEQHAALIWTAAGRFAIEPIRGPIRVMSAMSQPGVKEALLQERRPLPGEERREREPLSLPVRSGRQELYTDRCCFQLADSCITFLVDILEPSSRLKPSEYEEARQGAALAALAAVMSKCHRDVVEPSRLGASSTETRPGASSTETRNVPVAKESGQAEQRGERREERELRSRNCKRKPERAARRRKSSEARDEAAGSPPRQRRRSRSRPATELRKSSPRRSPSRSASASREPSERRPWRRASRNKP